MSSISWHFTVSETFPSVLGAHQHVLEDILRRLRVLGWTEADVFGVHMALEESLTNAIRHGNRLDDSKCVTFECKLNDSRLWATVADEGPGFNPHDVPDCTAPENLESPGGRGLMLIRAYMSVVSYNDCGNQVTMEKKLGD